MTKDHFNFVYSKLDSSVFVGDNHFTDELLDVNISDLYIEPNQYIGVKSFWVCADMSLTNDQDYVICKVKNFEDALRIIWYFQETELLFS